MYCARCEQGDFGFYDSDSSSDDDVCRHGVPTHVYCSRCEQGSRCGGTRRHVVRAVTYPTARSDDARSPARTVAQAAALPEGCEIAYYHPGKFGWNWTPMHWGNWCEDWSCCASSSHDARGCEKRVVQKVSSSAAVPAPGPSVLSSESAPAPETTTLVETPALAARGELDQDGTPSFPPPAYTAPGWTQYTTMADGVEKHYWHNSRSGITTWERPTGPQA